MPLESLLLALLPLMPPFRLHAVSLPAT